MKVYFSINAFSVPDAFQLLFVQDERLLSVLIMENEYTSLGSLCNSLCTHNIQWIKEAGAKDKLRLCVHLNVGSFDLSLIS